MDVQHDIAENANREDFIVDAEVVETEPEKVQDVVVEKAPFEE